jgi:hypothetical protein
MFCLEVVRLVEAVPKFLLSIKLFAGNENLKQLKFTERTFFARIRTIFSVALFVHCRELIHNTETKNAVKIRQLYVGYFVECYILHRTVYISLVDAFTPRIRCYFIMQYCLLIFP